MRVCGNHGACVREGDDSWVPPITSHFSLDEESGGPGPSPGPDTGKSF